MKHIQQIVAATGDMVDMDDDAEEKRRLDRARVLVKTPWNPPIKHTVKVHIGDEQFNVFVVEECGGGSHGYRGSRRSLDRSSEEISSDESYFGSSTPRSANGPSLEEEGCLATVPTITGPQLVATSSIVDDDNPQTYLLSDSQRDHLSTPGKRSTSRSSDASRGQTTSAASQPTETCHCVLLTKQGVKQTIGNATPAKKSKIKHENGKSGKEGCCAEVKTHRVADNEPREGEARDDVAVNHIPFNPRDRQGDSLSIQNRPHVTPLEIATCEEPQMNTENRFGPHQEIGPTICTPTQPIQQLGFSPKSSKGGLQSTCKVYLRQRWFKKKKHTGQNPTEVLLEKEMSSMQSHHMQGTSQKGIASNINRKSQTRPTPQDDDPMLETEYANYMRDGRERGEREEREECLERDTRWVRVTSRAKRGVRNRVSLRNKPHERYAETRGTVRQSVVAVNWRDHPDISSFYFTRFTDDITEKENKSMQ